MNIKFNKVYLNNFLSFGEATISLGDRRYTLVSGENNNPTDSAKSNGSGKTSIWEAISWVLTGSTIRGSCKNISNIYTNEGAVVEVDFDLDNVNYRIMRTKDNSTYGTSLKIWVNGEDKSGKGIRDTNILIQEYLPNLTSELIGSVIILGQGLPQRFSNNTPSGRKEVLENLTKTDFMIEDLKQRITDRKTFLQNKIKEFEVEIISKESAKANFEHTVDNRSFQLNNLKNSFEMDREIFKCAEQVSVLQAELDNIQKECTGTESLMQGYYNQSLALGDEEIRQVRQLEQDSFRDIDEKSREKSQLESALSYTDKEINRIESIRDVCPTCNQRLPDVHKPDTTALQQERINLQEKLYQVDSVLNFLKQNNADKIAEVINFYRCKKQECTEITNRFREELSQKKTQFNTIKAEYDKEVERLYKLRAEREQLETYRNMLTVELNDALAQVATLKTDLEQAKANKELWQTHLNTINSFASVASREFRGYLIQNIVQFLDSKAKEYSGDIFDNSKISIELDGNNLGIYFDGKQYENLSGGEKQKIDLIVQFSIRDMLCDFFNFSCNILVVDECFDNLDSVGCQRVIDLMANRLKDISSVFIVTHHTDIDIPYDSEIVVVKNERGVSGIR